MRGKVVKLLRDLHRAQFLESEWTAFLESLPPSAPWRRDLDDDEWVIPAEVAQCEAQAVARLGASTVRVRGEVVAEYAVESRLPGLVVDQGVPGLLRTLSVYWSWVHQGNILRLDRLDGRTAQLRMEGPIPYPEWATTVAPAQIRRTMELTGALKVDIEVHPVPPDGLRFDVRWTED